jgi:hypothetical protein
MMTTYGYGFSLPEPPPAPPPPNYTLWIIIAAGLLWAYKTGGLKKLAAFSAASPTEEIAAGGSIL